MALHVQNTYMWCHKQQQSTHFGKQMVGTIMRTESSAVCCLCARAVLLIISSIFSSPGLPVRKPPAHTNSRPQMRSQSKQGSLSLHLPHILNQLDQNTGLFLCVQCV